MVLIKRLFGFKILQNIWETKTGASNGLWISWKLNEKLILKKCIILNVMPFWNQVIFYLLCFSQKQTFWPGGCPNLCLPLGMSISYRSLQLPQTTHLAYLVQLWLVFEVGMPHWYHLFLIMYKYWVPYLLCTHTSTLHSLPWTAVITITNRFNLNKIKEFYLKYTTRINKCIHSHSTKSAVAGRLKRCIQLEPP